MNAVPYGRIDLLRFIMACIGKATAGVNPRPTISVASCKNPAPHINIARIFNKIFFSRREICTWVVPRVSAVCCWVL